MSEQQDKQTPEVSGGDAQMDARRRKLVALGASSSLLLTIASRPAWASGTMCSPSAMASANLSGQDTFEGCGISAGWWQSPNGKLQWPEPVYLTSLFIPIFGEVKLKGKSEVLFAGQTLENVIDTNGRSTANPANIGMHLVAAYLNALTFPPGGPNPVGYMYTAAQVVMMYSGLSVISGGAPEAEFRKLKEDLEYANNLYDKWTAKPL
ncbi:hypothetical protein CWI75_17295 [Kineobactrum sediminis]|uniref:Uncharacterized protein n=1 Tax=Kineobactrum sediminis TaxID=1905677 RepID=A0A2N5XYG9_9GAMM|nr:hypothetical protein [Kineobactrum sediminis]PLW81188.1 hypothetical protein CWI75_17295 [Kineobactrum sediminis]